MDASPQPAAGRPVVEISSVSKVFAASGQGGRPVEALVDIDLSVIAGRVHLAHRAIRVRQVHAAADRG